MGALNFNMPNLFVGIIFDNVVLRNITMTRDVRTVIQVDWRADIV